MDLSVVLVVVMMRAGRKAGLEIFGIESMGRALSELGEVAYRFDWVENRGVFRQAKMGEKVAGSSSVGFFGGVNLSGIYLIGLLVSH